MPSPAPLGSVAGHRIERPVAEEPGRDGPTAEERQPGSGHPPGAGSPAAPDRGVVTLPAPRDPAASVVMLAWRSPLVVASLRAVAAAGAGHPFEVVVVLNGAAPEIIDLVTGSVVGARIVSSPVNLGFSGGCYRGARAARGGHLVFLNDDTEVQAGWLDALLDTVEGDGSIGAVGSRLLFDDGTIQEAGAVLLRDASTMTVGRGEPDVAGTYLERRDVDYCSAAALLVRRSAWEAVGGFDDRYFPAYYEDVDLCLSIREAGLRVVYEPRSRVVHHESATLDSAYKTFVHGRMRDRFREKWAGHLGLYVEGDPWSPATVERAVRRAAGTTG